MVAPAGSSRSCSGAPRGVAPFARENYRDEIDIEAVHHVYGLGPLTTEVIARLNPRADVWELAGALDAIGLAIQLHRPAGSHQPHAAT
jgi:hypothetical protein